MAAELADVVVVVELDDAACTDMNVLEAEILAVCRLYSACLTGIEIVSCFDCSEGCGGEEGGLGASVSCTGRGIKRVRMAIVGEVWMKV